MIHPKLPPPLARGRRFLFAVLVGTGVLQAAGSLVVALATQAVFGGLVMQNTSAAPAIAPMLGAIAALARA